MESKAANFVVFGSSAEVVVVAWVAVGVVVSVNGTLREVSKVSVVRDLIEEAASVVEVEVMSAGEYEPLTEEIVWHGPATTAREESTANASTRNVRETIAKGSAKGRRQDTMSEISARILIGSAARFYCISCLNCINSEAFLLASIVNH